MHRTLHWEAADWIRSGNTLHADRAFYPPGFAFPWHDHDYAECSYIENGAGRHDLPEATHAVGPGDLVFFAPPVRHRFRADQGQSLQFVNIAVHGSVYAQLAARFAPTWPWQNAEVRRLSNPDRAWLDGEIARLFRRGHGESDPLHIEALLVGLLSRVSRSQQQDSGPSWLPRLHLALEDAEFLRSGVSALADALGCSREHLGRVVRARWGVSVQTLMNRSRAALAAKLLAAGETDPETVAQAAGFESVANYYRQFRQHQGCTPLRHSERAAQPFV